jgi:hypothetical protein
MTNLRKIIIATVALAIVSVSWLGTAEAGISFGGGLSVDLGVVKLQQKAVGELPF